MRVLIVAAFVAAGLFGCQEKNVSTKNGGLVQGSAPVAPNAAAEPKVPTAGNPTMRVGTPVIANPDEPKSNAPIVDPNANLAKTTDETGKTVYFKKQDAPAVAPSIAEMQSKLIKVPVANLAAPSASRVAFFTGQNFYFAMAARTSEADIFEKHYKNKWLKFNSDQSFELFQNANSVGKGRWTFRESDNNLFLSCDDAYINNSWKFQSMPAAVLLVGNTELNKTGIQARLFMTDEKPH